VPIRPQKTVTGRLRRFDRRRRELPVHANEPAVGPLPAQEAPQVRSANIPGFPCQLYQRRVPAIPGIGLGLARVPMTRPPYTRTNSNEESWHLHELEDVMSTIAALDTHGEGSEPPQEVSLRTARAACCNEPTPGSARGQRTADRNATSSAERRLPGARSRAYGLPAATAHEHGWK
jgi:hypothetical protein